MSKVTDQERNDIQDFLHFHPDLAYDNDYDIMEDRIVVMRNYMPDGPSWYGDIFFIVWGEANFITIVGRRSDSNDYEMMYQIDDGSLRDAGWI